MGFVWLTEPAAIVLCHPPVRRSHHKSLTGTPTGIHEAVEVGFGPWFASDRFGQSDRFDN